METDLEIAYSTLNAISQGQPVSQDRINFALACVNRAIHQVRALRRDWEHMSSYLGRPDVYSALESGPGPLPPVLAQQILDPTIESRRST